jgi:hypothetical protein
MKMPGFQGAMGKRINLWWFILGGGIPDELAKNTKRSCSFGRQEDVGFFC